MWIITEKGFFSVVHKINDAPDTLTVRARCRADLERLRHDIPLASPIETGTGTDYPYRCTVDRVDFAAWLTGQVMDLDYHNFKSRVMQRFGAAREAVYLRVWQALIGLEKLKN